MSFFRKFSGLVIAVLIGLGTLYVLFLAYNRYETKRQSVTNFNKTFIEFGDEKSFPQWNEIAEFLPLSKLRYEGVLKGDKVFDVIYELDKYSFRKEDTDSHLKEGHLLLGGCSFIFGNAINKEDTLSSYLRKKLPNVKVMNMGHGGGGLHTQLRVFDLVDLHEYAPEQKGTYIYFFFVDHIHRWKANPSYLSWAQGEDVHWEWNQGKLEPMLLKDFKGYKEFHEAKSAGLENVYIKSRAINNKGWDQNDLKLYVKAVKILREKYLRKYPGGRFVFAFYPLMPDLEMAGELKKILMRENIPFIDFKPAFDEYASKGKFPDEYFNVPLDGHPNGKFNEYFSGTIINHLK